MDNRAKDRDLYWYWHTEIYEQAAKSIVVIRKSNSTVCNTLVFCINCSWSVIWSSQKSLMSTNTVSKLIKHSRDLSCLYWTQSLNIQSDEGKNNGNHFYQELIFLQRWIRPAHPSVHISAQTLKHQKHKDSTHCLKKKKRHISGDVFTDVCLCLSFLILSLIHLSLHPFLPLMICEEQDCQEKGKRKEERN